MVLSKVNSVNPVDFKDVKPKQSIKASQDYEDLLGFFTDLFHYTFKSHFGVVVLKDKLESYDVDDICK